MSQQPETPSTTPEADATGGTPDKKPCNTLPEVADERNNDIVERIGVLIGHADIAGPDWIKDVLVTARQTIVELRDSAAPQTPSRGP